MFLAHDLDRRARLARLGNWFAPDHVIVVIYVIVVDDILALLCHLLQVAAPVGLVAPLVPHALRRTYLAQQYGFRHQVRVPYMHVVRMVDDRNKSAVVLAGGLLPLGVAAEEVLLCELW